MSTANASSSQAMHTLEASVSSEVVFLMIRQLGTSDKHISHWVVPWQLLVTHVNACPIVKNPVDGVAVGLAHDADAAGGLLLLVGATGGLLLVVESAGCLPLLGEAAGRLVVVLVAAGVLLVVGGAAGGLLVVVDTAGCLVLVVGADHG